MRFRVLCGALLFLAACGADESATPAPSSTAAVLAAFEGEFDALTGIVTVRVASEPPGGAGRAALVNLPEGSGVDTVSLSLSGGGVVSGGCNPGDTFQVNASINSHYASNMLVNVYAEITSMSLTGREGCNSIAQYPAGLSSQYGLWKYGAIAPGASKAQLWKFHNPNNTSYRFSGVIKGTVLAPIATTPYATGANPVSSVFDGARIWVASQATSSGQSSTLRSVTAASGVIGTAVNVLAYPTVIQDVVTAETNSVLWVASADGAPGGAAPSGGTRRATPPTRASASPRRRSTRWHSRSGRTGTTSSQRTRPTTGSASSGVAAAPSARRAP